MACFLCPQKQIFYLIFIIADTHFQIDLLDYQLIWLSIYLFSMVCLLCIALVPTRPKAKSNEMKAG